MPESDKPLFS